MRSTLFRLTAILFLCCSAHASDSEGVVNRFVAAFNAHDVDAMLAIASDEVRWMSIAGSMISVEAHGIDELAAAMTNYFASLASARSEIRSITGSGPFVHTVEEAFWVADGVEKSACGAAVYEIAAGKIVNVWYFSAYDCP